MCLEGHYFSSALRPSLVVRITQRCCARKQKFQEVHNLKNEKQLKMYKSSWTCKCLSKAMLRYPGMFSGFVLSHEINSITNSPCEFNLSEISLCLRFLPVKVYTLGNVIIGIIHEIHD